MSISAISPQAGSTPGSNPSALSILLARQREGQSSSSQSSQSSTPKQRAEIRPPQEGIPPTIPESPKIENAAPLDEEHLPSPAAKRGRGISQGNGELNAPSESTPLLADVERGRAQQRPSFSSTQSWRWPEQPSATSPGRSKLAIAAKRLRAITSSEALKNTALIAAKSVPAVLLGSLLNILDGVSCAYMLLVFSPSTHQLTSNRVV